MNRPTLPSVLVLQVEKLSAAVLAAGLCTALLAPAGLRAQASQAATPATDSAAVAQIVHAYHEALRGADTATVSHLLAADVRVAESGGVETRDEYLHHHLGGDMTFAAAVERTAGPLHVTVVGDVAWVTSTSRTTGTFRDRTIDSMGAELMVLGRESDGWRIRAIHWSSRPAR